MNYWYISYSHGEVRRACRHKEQFSLKFHNSLSSFFSKISRRQGTGKSMLSYVMQLVVRMVLKHYRTFPYFIHLQFIDHTDQSTTQVLVVPINVTLVPIVHQLTEITYHEYISMFPSSAFWSLSIAYPLSKENMLLGSMLLLEVIKRSDKCGCR